MSVVAIIGVVMEAMIVMVSTCKKKASRAAGKLRERPNMVKAARHVRNPAMTRRYSLTPFLSSKKKGAGIVKNDYEIEIEEEEEGNEVWQRTILMGEKCQPLEFSGVIFYDSKGKQLDEYPTSRRSRTRSPWAVSGSQPFSHKYEKMAGDYY